MISRFIHSLIDRLLNYFLYLEDQLDAVLSSLDLFTAKQ